MEWLWPLNNKYDGHDTWAVHHWPLNQHHDYSILQVTCRGNNWKLPQNARTWSSKYELKIAEKIKTKSIELTENYQNYNWF